MPNEEIAQTTSTPDAPSNAIATPISIDPPVLDTPTQTITSPEVQTDTAVESEQQPTTAAVETPVPTKTDAPKDDSSGDPHLDFMLGKIGHKELEAKLKEAENGKKPYEDDGKVPEQQPAPKTQPHARDYTGLNEDEQRLFKNMSAESYKRMRPIYDQHKKIAEREAQIAEREKQINQALPKGVFDVEDAYILSPQFRAAHTAAEGFKYEADYWSKQLEAIESGEKWKPLMLDPKTNEFYEGKPQDATPQAKAAVMRNLAQATQQYTVHQQRVAEVQGSFQARRSALVNGVRSYEKQFFPFFEGDNNPHKPAIQSLLNAIPEEFRDHPLASGYAKAMHTIKLLHENNTKLQAAVNMKAKAGEDTRRAGPTMSRVNNSAPTKPSGGGERDFDKMSPDDVIAAFHSRR